MTEIVEVPIQAEEPTENTAEILEVIPENTEDNPSTKKRGRPPGAKNKAKPAPAPKPKPKPKAKVNKVIEYEDEDYEEEYEEPPPRRRRAPELQYVPQEVDRNALAAEVLGILQQQRYSQRDAKRAHYASWFTNM